MNIAAYCRVSTNKEDQLNSLEVQKSFFEEYAKKNNYNLVRIYADEGISGTKTKNRKEFLRMMKDSESKLFDMVVVKDISRLARNAVDFLQGIRHLKSKGVKCNFVNANLTSYDSEMVLGTLALVAQEESANTSKRIKMSKRINAEKGRVPNIVYGYDKIKGDYFNLTKNDYEVNVVQRIFHMYLEQGYGANKIASILNSEGIRTKRDSNFTQNAIIRILTNEIYTGRIVNNKQEIKDFLTGDRTNNTEEDWIINEKPELRIISDEDFIKVKETLKERYDSFKIKKERHSNAYPFSTLIKCEHCGYSFRRTQYTYVNTFTKWVCSGRNANGAGSCPNKTVLDEKELLDAIRDYLVSRLKNKDSFSKEMVKDFNKKYKAKYEIELDAKELTTELNKLKKKRNRELDLYSDEIITKQELKERTDAISQRIKEVERDLELANKNLTKSDALSGFINTQFSSIEKAISEDTMTNAMLKQIISKITVNADGNVNIHMKVLEDIGLDNTYTYSASHT